MGGRMQRIFWWWKWYISWWGWVLNQFSRSVASNCLQPHEPQHARPPCASPTPGVHPNLCPLSQWCHPTISSSVVPFSSCPQFFPASGSFQMSQLFVSGGQSIGVSASAPVLPMNIQDWLPLGWTGWISLQSKGLSRVFSNTWLYSCMNLAKLSTLKTPPFTNAMLLLTKIYNEFTNSIFLTAKVILVNSKKIK